MSALCFTPWTTKFVCNQKGEKDSTATKFVYNKKGQKDVNAPLNFLEFLYFSTLFFKLSFVPFVCSFLFLIVFFFLLHEHCTTFPLNKHNRWHNQMMLRDLTFWEAEFSNHSPMVPIFSEYPLLLFSIFDYFLVEIQHCWTFRTLVEHAGCLKVVPPIHFAATWLTIPPKVAKNEEDTHCGEDKHTNIEHMNEIRAI